jgi:hypothetical protein
VAAKGRKYSPGVFSVCSIGGCDPTLGKAFNYSPYSVYYEPTKHFAMHLQMDKEKGVLNALSEKPVSFRHWG